jgi:uncharacterized protein involved in type VI secretion and phage assembly
MVVAKVLKNDGDCEKGMIKVEFPKLDGAPESAYARLMTPMAGKDRGWVTLPEPDDEVVVCFAHGNINNAIVVGGVYNGQDLPPYANEDEENNLRVFQSRSGHRVTFDDTSGDERIELISNNEEIWLIWDAKENTFTMRAGKNICIEAVNKISVTCKDFILGADQSMSLQSGMTTDVTNGTNLSVNGGVTLALKAALTTIN